MKTRYVLDLDDLRQAVINFVRDCEEVEINNAEITFRFSDGVERDPEEVICEPLDAEDEKPNE